MEGIENFIPLMNFRVGATLTFLLWTVNISRDRVFGEKTLAFLPININDDVCDWTLRTTMIGPSNEEATITMTTVDVAGELTTTKLNTSHISLYNVNLCVIQDVDWNVTEGILFESENMYLDIQNDLGHVIHLPSIKTDDNEILVSSDSKTTCIFGNKNLTDVSLYSFTENSISYERTEELLFMKYFCFNNTDYVLVNSSTSISSYIFKGDNEFGLSEVIGYAPTTSYLGNMYHIVFPDTSLIEIQIIAPSNGVLIINNELETRTYNLSSYETLYLNLTGTKYAALNSSVPTQVFCRILYNYNIGRWNEFFLFPSDIYSSCHVFKVNNCVDAVCALVFRPSSDVLYLFDGNGQRCSENGVLKRKSGIYNVWEISNLANGRYFLHTNDRNGSLIFFHLDKTNGTFFPAYPFIDTFCNEIDVLNATDNSLNTFNGSDNHVIYLDTSSDIPCLGKSYANGSSTEPSTLSGKDNFTENVDVNSSIACQNCSSTLINCSMNATQTNDTTNMTTDNQHEELQKPSYISQSNNSIEISVSSIDDDNRDPNYDYLYHEVPGDDSNLHDYMIAVIVSLCVAIFAVIAVISTFFLLEFLSRRKQLRNTKIRPFVS